MAERKSEVLITVLSRCDNCPKRGAGCPIDVAVDGIGEERTLDKVTAVTEQAGLRTIGHIVETNTSGLAVKLTYLGCPQLDSKVPGKVLIQNTAGPKAP